MNESGKENLETTAGRIVDRLRSVRDASAALPADERRGQFERALEAELDTVPGDSADRVLDVVRERLLDEARARARRVAELERQVQALETELASASAERDRLRRDAEQRAATAAPVATAPASGAGGLERLREGLLRASRGEDVTAEQIGLPGADARLWGLIRSMLDFALRYEIAFHLLLAEFKVGPAADADTRLTEGMQEQVRQRFRACLQNQEGSLEALKEVLERNARFLIDLNRAYQAAIYDGSQAVLARLDPRPIQDKHKRVLGSDYEGAWRTISREQSDLAGLSRTELWEQFFLEPFQAKLASFDDAS